MPLNDRGASLLEDAEGSRAHGHEVSIAITNPGLDGGDATRAVDDLGGAGDPTLPHGTEEADVKADSRRPQADERGHRESHGVVRERDVDPAVQRPVAVEVDVLHVYRKTAFPGSTSSTLLPMCREQVTFSSTLYKQDAHQIGRASCRERV